MARQYTREIIREQFVALLEEKPLDDITVKELVERCQINRKTFYYYYQDLYQVLAELFQSELDRVIACSRQARSWEEGILSAADFAVKHRRAVEHIYHSLRREDLEHYLFNVAGDIMNRYVDSASEGLCAHEADKRMIALFYQSAMTQMVLHWIDGGMQAEPVQTVGRLGKLLDGNIEISLKRSEQLPPNPWKPQR